jgi:hypothetical protein
MVDEKHQDLEKTKPGAALFLAAVKNCFDLKY